MKNIHTKRCRRARAQAGPSGLVLVVVLLVVAMISLAGFSFAELMFTENKAVHLHGDELQSEQLAESGVELIKSMAAQSAIAREQAGGCFDNPRLFRDVPLSPVSRLARGAEPSGRFSIVSPRLDAAQTNGFRYGLEYESARLSLTALLLWETQSPGAGRQALLQLPGMTPAAADSILDWMDADDRPRDYGAEHDDYADLEPPYAPRNGPPAVLEELLLVKGVSRAALLGDGPSVGRDREATPQTPPRRTAVPATDSHAAAPWSALLTLYSGERNQTRAGEPRIYANDRDLRRLYARLSEALDEPWARFIVFYRQYGPYSEKAADGSAAPASPEPDLSVAAKFSLASPLDLVDARVRMPAADGRPQRVVASPATGADALREALLKLMDKLTVSRAPVLRGLVNVNLAPAAVLRCVPGIDAALADRIVVARAMRGQWDAAAREFPTWLLAEGLVDLRRMKSLLPYVTSGGDVFRAEVIGLPPQSGPVARVQVIIDGTSSPPRQVYRRDLRSLGRGGLPELPNAQSLGEGIARWDLPSGTY